jgi:alkylhydroperoxidase/carboxymuconolactone decarboxylase family protein YurZ
MDKNYSDMTKRIAGDLKKLRKDIPDTMQAFSALAQAATRDGALDKKTNMARVDRGSSATWSN